jgi:RNA polymerase sigma-70 factor (ECF subfamily)
MQPVSRDDADVHAAVAGVLAGDREAFRLLVERESANVFRTCYRVLGSLPEAEDTAQEAFVIAFRSLGTWRGEGPFGAWIARIAVRLALRQAGRRKTVAWLDPLALGGEAGPAGAPAQGTRVALDRQGPDPAVLAIRSERDATVRLAVARLDEPYREVVALRFFGELSLAEIAAASGRPLGTVKTHLRRGLLRLRSSLEGAEYQP